MDRFKTLQARLFAPIDIAPLVFFRVVFGGIMLWEVWRYFHFNRIARYYVDTTTTFTYFGFDWVQPLPGDGMFLLFHGIGALSMLIMLGAAYRLTMVVFWLCFTYVFLLDYAQYLNHFYLISLISFLMIFIPAHRALSVDALLRPSIRSQVAPNWSLWLLRSQMAIVYFFGGIAKINADWLVGEPLRQWMSEVTDFPVIGHLFTEEWMVMMFSYGGLLLDLFIVPLLLWHRTRIPALLLATVFHLTNARLFNIGIFPWFAIGATLLFLPPHWFRLGVLKQIDTTQFSIQARRGVILMGMGAFFAVQIALPLRHFLYPGNPSWTEEGHTLAWHMRLRSKAGDIAFYASDPNSGATWQVDAEPHLSSRQFRQMADNPHMILQFAHYLEGTLRDEGYDDVQIRVRSMMWLNNRTPQLLIDPTADLTREPQDLWANDWTLPLVQRPAPNDPRPAILVSRRYDGVLVLANITQTTFPLGALQIDTGAESLTNLGVNALQADECLILHDRDADLLSVFLPCNEAGSRVEIDVPDIHQVALVDSRGRSHICDRAVCVLTLD